MIENQNFPQQEEPAAGQTDQELNDINPLSLEEQEQRNSENLVQRIEEENQPDSDYGDANERIDQGSQAEEDLSTFLDRTLPSSGHRRPTGNDKPVTKNLLGDNPPGSEQAAFDAGNVGDMNADQAKFIADNLEENFRENLDKTQNQVELDKKLRNDQPDN